MGKEYPPFKMKGFSGFGNSPAKRADVYIDGENVGTGEEAMKKGIAAEKVNVKAIGETLSSSTGTTEESRKAEEDRIAAENKKVKHVTYDKEDAISRIKMTTGDEKKSLVDEYKKTGTVSGKGADRAIGNKMKAQTKTIKDA